MPRAPSSSRSEGGSAAPETRPRWIDEASLPLFARGIEQDLQEIRRADIPARPVVRDRVELLFGVADPARDHRTTKRMRARLQQVGAGGEVIGERVVQDVACAHAGGEQRARRTGRILAVTFGLEDRTGRHQQPLGLARHDDGEAAEWRFLLLQPQQVGFAQHRQARQHAARGDLSRIDAGQMIGPAGRRHRQRDGVRQPAEQIVLARHPVAGLERIVVIGHRFTPSRRRAP